MGCKAPWYPPWGPGQDNLSLAVKGLISMMQWREVNVWAQGSSRTICWIILSLYFSWVAFSMKKFIIFQHPQLDVVKVCFLLSIQTFFFSQCSLLYSILVFCLVLKNKISLWNLKKKNFLKLRPTIVFQFLLTV